MLSFPGMVTVRQNFTSTFILAGGKWRLLTLVNLLIGTEWGQLVLQAFLPV